MQLYHYSHKPDLYEIDPQFYGQNKSITPEYKQGIAHLMPRSYFYSKDEPEGVVASGRYRYTADLPNHFKIYNLSQDPEKLVEVMHQKTGMYGRGLHDEIEHEINRRGYHGYHVPEHPQLPHVMVLFHKLPITNASDTELAKS